MQAKHECLHCVTNSSKLYMLHFWHSRKSPLNLIPVSKPFYGVRIATYAHLTVYNIMIICSAGTICPAYRIRGTFGGDFNLAV